MTLNQHTQTFLKIMGLYSGGIDGAMGPLSQQAISDMMNLIASAFANQRYSLDKDYNLIGVRASDLYTNKFTDWGVITHGNSLSAFPMSTKPGSKYFLNKQYIDSVKGCACLKEGQYSRVWVEMNNGWSGMPYLMQTRDVTVYRDSDMDYAIDTDHESTGLFGINFHSWTSFTANFVQNLSAGCQVIQADVHKDIWPYIHEMSKHGSITYTLLKLDDFKV